MVETDRRPGKRPVEICLSGRYAQVGLVSFLLISILYTEALWPPDVSSAPNPAIKNKGSIVFVTSRALTENDLYALFPHKGTGPGFVLDHQGHIVCASSIISDVHAIEVTLPDKSFWPAKLVGKDRETGMALLKLKAPEEIIKGLRPLKIPKTWRLALGETVWALGVTPTGRPMAAKGIVTVPRRTIIAGKKRWDGLIQTSIPVNGSFNGAPLFDSVGKVVGMNIELNSIDAAMSQTGFALGIDRIAAAAQRLIEGRSPNRVWLGASFIPIDATLSRLLDLPQEKGILLVKVDPDGPAAKAGLIGSTRRLRIGNKVYPLGGDFIVAIDRRPVENEEDLKKILNSAEPGKSVLISFYRNGRLMRLPVRLEALK